MELTKISGSWWKRENQHEDIFALVKHLEQHQSARKNKNLIHARLYSNSELLGLDSSKLNRSSQPLLTDRDTRIKLNVIASVIDTITSKIAKSRPKVVMLTNGGDFDLQIRSKQLEKFVAGVFYESDIYTQAVKSFLDTCIFGTGVIKIFQENGNVCAERILPSEIIVDDEEAFYGSPRQIHQKRDVAREVLLEMFPDHQRIINESGKIDDNIYTIDTSISDNVTVIESWHLPSGPNAKDGRHVISIDSGVLFEESYECDEFPFVFLRWKDPIVGFWGIGVAEDITGIQVEINKLLMKIQSAFDHLSNPMVFIQQGSAISKAHLSDKIGVIVPYTGNAPIIRAAQTVHPEVFQHLERLYSKAFEISGISQLSATSRKPDGLESGAALREFNDIESERFSIVSQQYEKMFIDIGMKMIKIAREIYATDKELEVTVKGKKDIEKIKWSEVSLEDDQFVLTVSAASSLPQTRAGRIQRATEWFQAGLIDAQEWRELLDIPDLDDNTELSRGPKDYIKQCISKILKDGEFTEPEAHDNLGFALNYSVLSYQRAKLDNVDEERLELLRLYIESVNMLLEQLKQKTVQEQMQLQQQMQSMQAAAQPQQGQVPEPIEGLQQ